MPEAEQTKVCPLCAETIKAAAKVCPHCRNWQFRQWWSKNPAFLQSLGSLIMAIAIFGAIVGLGVFLDQLIGPKRDFAPYVSQIKVTSSAMSFQMYNSNLNVSVTGTITNQTDFAWKDLGLEGRLFDKDGKLIDVIQAKDDSYGGVVVFPHAEAGFKIQGRAARKESDYVSHQIIVGTAKDFRTWP